MSVGILGIQDMLAGMYLHAGRTQKSEVSPTDFTELLQQAGDVRNISKKEIYQEYLKRRYGNVMIQDVGKDQRSIDSIGAGTSGTGNVVIAPNILEQMVNDPQKAAYYEGKIQHYYDTLPACQAQLSLIGHEIHSSGIVIHSDGTVTHYVSGDLKPEVRARIEAQMRAEAEAKAERKRAYLRQSEEAAYLRRLEMETAYHRLDIGAPGLISGLSGMNF